MFFELVFGASAYISGASSSQSAAEIANQPVQLSIAFRFFGSALISLGVLAAIIVFVAGVQSKAAKYAAVAFAIFHGLGAAGSLYTSAPNFEVYQQTLVLGALILHGMLAVGFSIIALSSPRSE